MKNIITLLLLASLSLTAYKSDIQQTNNNPQRRTAVIAQPATGYDQLSSEEREYAAKFLKETESGVFAALKNLNEMQLTFKPAADKWSVEECVKHIAASEKSLWAMVEESLKQPANPEKRAGIKMTDKELIGAVEDRSHKSKTFSALEPANSPYKTMGEALASFKENREKLIAFVKGTREDLRNHVSVLPMGTYDAYQLIMLISAHSDRHTQQIEEIKTNPNFPKG